ncbi:SRPBCC domain-containing protein [Actinoplanes sp. NPDC051494]|uniref:SRPBCC domain-containing protein n=1 Tax=Actinoplanes sp. NPDC051494 TaxID=3363907 RepID=UPI0037B0D70F
MSDTDLVMTRIFDAPRAVVYRAFTDPEQLARWFGPVGWTVPPGTVDLVARPGGHQRFTMVNDADPAQTVPIDMAFTEVVENELLVGTEDMSAVDGFPGDTLTVRFAFHDEPDGRTRLVLTHSPYPPAWSAGANEAWEASFTKLDKLF